MLIQTPVKHTGPFAPILRDVGRHGAEFQRYLRNHDYEVGQGHIRFGKARIDWRGAYSNQIIRADGSVQDLGVDENTWVTEGLAYLLGAGFGNAGAQATWYNAISSTNTTPLTTWTAANYASNATEITTGYSEASRPEWNDAAVVGTTKSFSARAEFTATGSAMNVWGVALLSDSTKGGTSGVLASAEKRSGVATIAVGEKFATGFFLTLNAA